MQTSSANANMSVFGMIRTTLMKEGIPGIYRGVSAPLMATTPMFATSFWSYDIGKRIVQYFSPKEENDERPYSFSILQCCIAGGLSAIPTTLIMAPSERLKCLLQVDANIIESGGKPKYAGLWDCAVQVYKEGGIQSVFKGTGATLLRDIPGSIAWFGTYELAKKAIMKFQKIDPESGSLSPIAVLCAGGLAGMACWAVSIPPDVLKSRFQTAPPGKYSGILHVYRDLMKQEGPGALFTGLRPAMIRAFPANAACFLGMEVARKNLTFLD
jgi:solute carrier family 25 carnitine/acylcarnitine transporter 20/29